MCCNLFSFVVYLYVNDSGSITSVGEERANLSAVVYLLLCGFCLERFPLPLGAWDGLRYFCGTPCTFYIIILRHGLMDTAENPADFLTGKLHPFQNSVRIKDDCVF